MIIGSRTLFVSLYFCLVFDFQFVQSWNLSPECYHSDILIKSLQCFWKLTHNWLLITFVSIITISRCFEDIISFLSSFLTFIHPSLLQSQLHFFDALALHYILDFSHLQCKGSSIITSSPSNASYNCFHNRYNKKQVYSQIFVIWAVQDCFILLSRLISRYFIALSNAEKVIIIDQKCKNVGKL